MVPADDKIYLSFDGPVSLHSDVDCIDDVHTLEFLNTIVASGVPAHALKLKVGVPVMLLRNLDHSLGMCNGTRLIISRLGKYVLEQLLFLGLVLDKRFTSLASLYLHLIQEYHLNFRGGNFR